MMKNLITTVLIGLLMFIIIVGIILLIGLGLAYILQYIPCEILVYIMTGLLLGIFMLVASLFINTKEFEEFSKGITLKKKDS